MSSTDNNQISPELAARMRRLVPLNELTNRGFEKILEFVRVKGVRNKSILFKEGDDDDKSIYVIDGQVELFAGHVKPIVLNAGDDNAQYPMSNLKPRRFSARALKDSLLVEFPSQELERIVHWDQVATMDQSHGYEVSEVTEDDHLSWIFHMIQSPPLAQLPAANIQGLFTAFEAMPVRAGTPVVREGEQGDYYYVIDSGTCEVSRQTGEGKTELLATLSDGDTFGEEALLSEQPRNATVTATSEAVLMRLSKDAFTRLLRDPILHWVKPEDISKEPYVLLDVRPESEFKENALKDAVNLPLLELRQEAKALNAQRKYLVYCDNGSRSASAAYLLAERGFDVSVLKGGLSSLESS